MRSRLVHIGWLDRVQQTLRCQRSLYHSKRQLRGSSTSPTIHESHSAAAYTHKFQEILTKIVSPERCDGSRPEFPIAGLTCNDTEEIFVCKIGGITTDNASNMLKFGKKLRSRARFLYRAYHELVCARCIGLA
jgi:hypothetical protein